MLARVPTSGASAQTQADLALYLEVALGLLDPQGSTTRAQVATFMMRFCAEIEK